jgi:hypothetical protein
VLSYPLTTHSFERQLSTNRDKRMYDALKSFPYMLRKVFPERFQGSQSSELVIPISAGDYPALRAIECIQSNSSRKTDSPCTDLVSPVVHFGSVFKRRMFPNIIRMPMPVYNHLDCFEQWVSSGTVCPGLRSNQNGGELVHDVASWSKWEKLIPQLVWRG